MMTDTRACTKCERDHDNGMIQRKHVMFREYGTLCWMHAGRPNTPPDAQREPSPFKIS